MFTANLIILLSVSTLIHGENFLPPYVKHEVNLAKLTGTLFCPGIYHTIPSGYEDLTKKVSKSTGLIITECEDKQYLLTRNKYKVNEMWGICAKYGMIPASIESMGEIRCISDNFWKKNKQDSKVKNYDEMYWTAHMDVNLDSKFTSCVTGQSIKNDAWNPLEPNNDSGRDACVGLHLGLYFGLGMFDIPCDVQIKIICEFGRDAKMLVKDLKVENIDSPCPGAAQNSSAKSQNEGNVTGRQYSNLVVDKLKEQGLLQCPSNLINFAQVYEKFKDSLYKEVSKSTSIVISDCPGKKYILTKYTVSMADIWTECAQYGMVPAVLELKEELQCIASAYVKYIKKSSGDHKYLTSVFDIHMNRSFTSCVTSSEVAANLWVTSQPDNANTDEACAALNLAGAIGYQDVTCDEPQLKLMCESGKNAKKLLTTVPQKPKPESSDTCVQKSVGAEKFKQIKSTCKVRTLKETSFTKIMQGLQSIAKTIKLKIRI